MKPIVFIALALVTAIGCGTQPQPRAEVDRLALEAVLAPLPAQATEVFGQAASAFTRSISIRFRCSEAEFIDFLAQTRNVERKLVTDERSVVDSMCSEPWWRPDRLRNVRGSTTSLNKGKQVGQCSLMVGNDEGSGIVVYIATTIEIQN